MLKYGPYSPSRLSVGVCGFDFYHTYVNPQGPRINSVAGARGSVVHEVFEKITRRHLSGQVDFTQEELRSWVTESMVRYPEAYSETNRILYMVDLYAKRPLRFLTKDVEIELKMAVSNFNGTWNEIGYDDPRAEIRGRADLLMISPDGDVATIVDHKTQPNKEDADTFQLGVYAWLVSKWYPHLKEIKTILHFAQYGFCTEPFTWDASSLMAVENELLTYIGAIEGRTSWDPNPHAGCTYCQFKMQCPKAKEFVHIEENGSIKTNKNNLKILGDHGKALQVAGIIPILEDMLREAKSNLEEYVSQTSPIALPGGKIIYEHRGKVKRDWDKVNKNLRQLFYYICEKHNEDPRDYMGLSETFSKNVWICGKEEFVKELAEAFPEKLETSFRGWKS